MKFQNLSVKRLFGRVAMGLVLSMSAGLHQQVEARGAHALEGVGGGAGLERAAPEQGRAGGLHVLGHGADLRLALHRAGAGDHGEISPADLGVPHGDHRVLRGHTGWWLP